MILLIDNYDSFSYNLYQLTASIRDDIKVIRNDAITLEEIEALNPDHILLSPGPGYPKDAGICEAVIRRFGSEIPILGVCLGHQAICETFGMTISHAQKLMHGKQSEIKLDTTSPLFRTLPSTILAARYHSLIAQSDTLPEQLKIIAVEPINQEIMAIQHKENPIFGVQFHPESIMTENGRVILENFLTIERNESIVSL